MRTVLRKGLRMKVRFEEKMKEVKDRDLLDLVMFSLRGGGCEFTV